MAHLVNGRSCKCLSTWTLELGFFASAGCQHLKPACVAAASLLQLAANWASLQRLEVGFMRGRS
jgi:hypothetical protein